MQASILGLVALMVIKIIVILLACKIVHIDNGVSIRVSMLLSQSDEIGFLLFGLAVILGLISVELFQILTLMIAMIIAPFITLVGERIERCFTIKTYSEKTIR